MAIASDLSYPSSPWRKRIRNFSNARTRKNRNSKDTTPSLYTSSKESPNFTSGEETRKEEAFHTMACNVILKALWALHHWG